MGRSTPILVDLRRIAKTRGSSVAEVLQYYAMERFLFRLGASAHADRFVLKGAMLLRVWDPSSSRSTRDIDFLAFGPNDLGSLGRSILEILAQEADEDGVQFDAGSLQVAVIKEHDEYQGVRAKFTARIESARIPMQLDIGFGDAVRPEILWETFPILLEAPAPRIRVYSRESIIAEKTHAMAKLGLINSRLKDYHDIWLLSQHWPFEWSTLVAAIEATFTARATAIPKDLTGLSREYVELHQGMWTNYLKKTALEAESFGVVVERLRRFIHPCLREASDLSAGEIRHWNPVQASWE
jgi:predicted nucleotidyltransferase component of viral defense system